MSKTFLLLLLSSPLILLGHQIFESGKYVVVVVVVVVVNCFGRPILRLLLKSMVRTYVRTLVVPDDMKSDTRAVNLTSCRYRLVGTYLPSIAVYILCGVKNIKYLLGEIEAASLMPLRL